MFVVYTGYDRIVTLDEEVKMSKITIPRGIVVTLTLVMVVMPLYAVVRVIGVGTTGTSDPADIGARAAEALAVGAAIDGLARLGEVRTTWSFSVFVLPVDCAITNLEAQAPGRGAPLTTLGVGPRPGVVPNVGVLRRAGDLGSRPCADRSGHGMEQDRDPVARVLRWARASAPRQSVRWGR